MQSDVADEIASGKVCIQGNDRKGRPCLYISAVKHLVAERDVEECKRYICYTLDRCIAQIDPLKNSSGTICVLFDLQGERRGGYSEAVLDPVFGNITPVAFL